MIPACGLSHVTTSLRAIAHGTGELGDRRAQGRSVACPDVSVHVGTFELGTRIDLIEPERSYWLQSLLTRGVR
jgi:hypothetical protein